MSGFAVLRAEGPDGGLALAVHWWEGAVLHRRSFLIAGGDTPPRRTSPAGCVGTAGETLLMAREVACWRRHVLDAALPSPAAYAAECCA